MKRWSVAALAWMLVTTRPAVALAHMDVCGMAGEYVLSASLVSHPGPGQLTGTFVFTAPAVCEPRAEGVATIDLQLVTPGGAVVPYRLQLPYTVQDATVLIGGGALRAMMSHESDGRAAPLALSGGAGLAVSGSLLRRPSAIDRPR
jgi:hypothetical protein